MSNPIPAPELQITPDGVSDESWTKLAAYARNNDATWRSTEEAAEVLGVDELSRLKMLCKALLVDKQAVRARSVQLAKQLGA